MEIELSNTTQIVAWWGAIIATSVLAWDVYKHFSNGPKIKTRIIVNVEYPDGKLVSEGTEDNVNTRTYEKYCHIEVINIGNMPTTIMGIEAIHKSTKTSNTILSAFYQAFSEHFGKKIPYVLLPGEVWSCRLNMVHYLGILEQNTPEIHVTLSHQNKPLVIVASEATNKALVRDAGENPPALHS